MVVMSSNKRILNISSRIRNYSVEFTSEIPDADYYIIDKTVYSLYNYKFKHLKNILLLKANEYTKSWNFLHEIIDHLLRHRIKRNWHICVIGGGTIQDAASFVLSILKRGIQWSFVPTTLLAQSDSCIGSKTSINFKWYKNQIGTFYPPSKVHINTDYLATLSQNDIKSGIGEIIKIHMIEGQHISEMERDLQAKNWNNLIYRSLLFKKKYIEEDEFDLGRRRILNYGHTFGHAIETATKFKIPHGIAIAEGIKIINKISNDVGYLTNEDLKAMNGLINKYVNPNIEIEKKNLADILEKDKKSGKNLKAVFTRGFGKMFIREIKFENLERLNYV